MKNVFPLFFPAFTFLMISIFSTSCQKEVEIITPFTFNNLDTLVHLKKSACFGFCPVYTVTVFKSGNIIYEGINNVENVGIFYRQLKFEQDQFIIDKANHIDFFNLANIYPEDDRFNLQDLPNTRILIKANGKRKEILINYNEPEVLKNFVGDVDNLLKAIVNSNRS